MRIGNDYVVDLGMYLAFKNPMLGEGWITGVECRMTILNLGWWTSLAFC